MIKLKAFKFRLRPTRDQQTFLGQIVGCARYCYNRALKLQMDRHENGLKKLSYPELSKELTIWKKQEESSFLKEVPAQILQQKLMDLDKAYQNFFQKRAGFPKFRKRGIHDSIRFPEARQIHLDEKNSTINLPKIGKIRYVNSRPLTGRLKNVTVSWQSGHWYMSIQTEEEVVSPVHESNQIVGIDRGITRFLTLSDGTVVAPANALSKRLKKLRRAQRILARRQKGSANRRKQRQKVAQIHRKIANTRQDFLHKVTSHLAKTYGTIILEDLRVKNMSASASGTLANPGKNVRAKAGLNRSILDQGWSEFHRQLTYKQAWRGGQVIVVPPAYTSQQCSCCGHISPENRNNQAVFRCVGCGHEDNADLNAAKNIEAAGHAVIACGEMLRPKNLLGSKAVSVKQEPPKHQAAA